MGLLSDNANPQLPKVPVDGISDASVTGASVLRGTALQGRAALGLGAAALLAVGITTGTVAAGDDSRIVGAVQSSVLTTRGDLPRRGASAWERFGASTADTFVGGDGTDVTVRTAAQVRTSLALPALALTSYGTGADTAWTGWAFSETGATSRTDGAVTGSRLRLTCTSGSAISPGGSAKYALTIPTTLRSRGWRWRARLATMSGSSSGSRWIISAGSPYMSVRPDGTVSVGSATTGDTASSSGALPVDGTGWVDAVHLPGITTLRYGTGTSSTPPTSWVNGVSYVFGAHVANPTVLNFVLEEYGSLAGTLTLEMDHATVGPTEDGGW